MLNFKIMAGNMYCGMLSVVPGFSHNFLDRDNNVISERDAINKVKGYKHLKLIRV